MSTTVVCDLASREVFFRGVNIEKDAKEDLEEMGIRILEEGRLRYRVALPEGWYLIEEDCSISIFDADGIKRIFMFWYPLFYDCGPYLKIL